MKQTELVKILKANSWELLRHGGNHDVYSNGKKTVAVPRHNEIKEFTAQAILKQCGIESKRGVK